MGHTGIIREDAGSEDLILEFLWAQRIPNGMSVILPDPIHTPTLQWYPAAMSSRLSGADTQAGRRYCTSKAQLPHSTPNGESGV